MRIRRAGGFKWRCLRSWWGESDIAEMEVVNRDHFKASILSMLPSSSYRIAEEETADVLAPAAATTCGVLFHLRFLFVSGMCRMFLVGAHLERGKDGHWGRRWKCHLHVPGGFQERRNRRFRRERMQYRFGSLRLQSQVLGAAREQRTRLASIPVRICRHLQDGVMPLKSCFASCSAKAGSQKV